MVLRIGPFAGGRAGEPRGSDSRGGPGPGRVSRRPREPQAGTSRPPPTHADAGGRAVLGAAVAVEAAALVAGQQRGAVLAALPGAHQAAGAAVQHGGHARGAARRLGRAAPAAGAGTRRLPAAHLRGQSGPGGRVTGPGRPPAPPRAPRTRLARPEQQQQQQQGGQVLPAARRHDPGPRLPAARSALPAEPLQPLL